MTEFIRYESAVPNRRGNFPGVFALANGLRAEGLLTAADEGWLREANDRATAAYVDPSSVQPDCYAANPGARSWFRSSATGLLMMTREYLELLDSYDVPWVELRTRKPGRVVYADADQVVAVAYSFPEDWPFRLQHESGSTQRRPRSA